MYFVTSGQVAVIGDEGQELVYLRPALPDPHSSLPRIGKPMAAISALEQALSLAPPSFVHGYRSNHPYGQDLRTRFLSSAACIVHMCTACAYALRPI